MAQVPLQRLFGGALSATFPLRFEDVSSTRDVPDHQEVFVDPELDESLIIEILEMKHDVADNTSATWFLQDLATEQGAESNIVTKQSAVLEAQGLIYIETCLMSQQLLLPKWLFPRDAKEEKRKIL